MDDERILDIVHQTAAEMMAAADGEVTGHGTEARAADADNLVDRYGFSSIDALKFLLTLEEKFGVTLADEDLAEEVLSSAAALAKRIAALRLAQGAAPHSRPQTPATLRRPYPQLTQAITSPCRTCRI